MITFKTKLTLETYFLANYYRLTDSVVEKIFLTVFIIGLMSSILIGDYMLSCAMIVVISFFYIVVPLIKYIYTQVYFKYDTIEYFFDTESFGYTLGDYKIEVKNDNIKSIVCTNNYIRIDVPKQKLYFFGDKNDIDDVKKKLLNSVYKDFISS